MGIAVDRETPIADGACITTSYALREALEHAIDGYTWRVVGGAPGRVHPLGGVRGKNHCWVQGRRGADLITVDITADQFGDEPVIVHAGRPSTHLANSSSRTLKSFQSRTGFEATLWTGAVLACLSFDPKWSWMRACGEAL